MILTYDSKHFQNYQSTSFWLHIGLCWKIRQRFQRLSEIFRRSLLVRVLIVENFIFVFHQFTRAILHLLYLISDVMRTGRGQQNVSYAQPEYFGHVRILWFKKLPEKNFRKFPPIEISACRVEGVKGNRVGIITKSVRSSLLLLISFLPPLFWFLPFTILDTAYVIFNDAYLIKYGRYEKKTKNGRTSIIDDAIIQNIGYKQFYSNSIFSPIKLTIFLYETEELEEGLTSNLVAFFPSS